MKTATMVLYMVTSSFFNCIHVYFINKTNIIEVCYTETPEYTLENFLSDVGGTAGLILG